MTTKTKFADTETEDVVTRHLIAFTEQLGVDAILEDYADGACLHGDAGTWRGKEAIGGFFEDFLAALPPGSVQKFKLRTLRVEGSLAYITWSAGDAIPLGTDTFVVHKGKIVSQTFAMYVRPS